MYLAVKRYHSTAAGNCLQGIIDVEDPAYMPTVANPSSGAYGLPQALPGSKMASAGSDWATNPVTQLRWQQQYVDSTYGGPCQALAYRLANGSY
jgi:hypothetical protein